jgi:pimeloyl-ACP methyl ester carboxylesterase
MTEIEHKYNSKEELRMNSRWQVLLVVGAMLLLGLSSVGWAADQPFNTDSVMSADSVMIHYDVGGQGEQALVFVHCWSCDRGYWSNQVEEFSKDYTVVTLDLGGHGESGMNRKTWTLQAFGADVAAVVNKLGLKQVILVGHSMGGPVCVEAARLLPGKVVAIIGVDTFQDFGRRFTPEQIAGFTAQFKADFPTFTAAWIKNMFPPTADSSLVTHVATDMASAPPDVAIGAMQSMLQYDGVAALKDMRVPIRGINSDRQPVNVEGNKAASASFEVTMMSGVGHFIQLEAPAAFNTNLHKSIEEFWPKK